MSSFPESSDYESVYDDFYATYQLLCKTWESHKGRSLTQTHFCELLQAKGILITQPNLCKLLSRQNKKQKKLISLTQAMKRLLQTPQIWSGTTLLLTNWELQQRIQAGKQEICLIVSCPELLLSLRACLEEAICQGTAVRLLLPHPCSPHLLFPNLAGMQALPLSWSQVLQKLWDLAKNLPGIEVRMGLTIPNQNEIQIDGCVYQENRGGNVRANQRGSDWSLLHAPENWTVDFARHWEQAVPAQTIFEPTSNESVFQEKGWHLFRAFYLFEEQTETFLMNYHPGSGQVVLSQTASKESFCGALFPIGPQSLIILQTSHSSRLRNAGLLADTGAFRLEERWLTLAVFNRAGTDRQLHSGRLLLVQITGTGEKTAGSPDPRLLKWLQESGDGAEILSLSNWPKRKASA